MQNYSETELLLMETAVSEPMEAVQTTSSARENSLQTCASRVWSGL